MSPPSYTKKSFGYYGGRRVRFIQHPAGVRGYEQKVCCLCDGKALYRVGMDGYCKIHKNEATKRLLERDGTFFAPRAAEYADREAERRKREQTKKGRRRGFK